MVAAVPSSNQAYVPGRDASSTTATEKSQVSAPSGAGSLRADHPLLGDNPGAPRAGNQDEARKQNGAAANQAMAEIPKDPELTKEYENAVSILMASYPSNYPEHSDAGAANNLVMDYLKYQARAAAAEKADCAGKNQAALESVKLELKYPQHLAKVAANPTRFEHPLP